MSSAAPAARDPALLSRNAARDRMRARDIARNRMLDFYGGIGTIARGIAGMAPQPAIAPFIGERPELIARDASRLSGSSMRGSMEERDAHETAKNTKESSVSLKEVVRGLRDVREAITDNRLRPVPGL
jgi:hypothetical protein